MEVLKVRKLKGFETIEHLHINQHYFAKVLPNKLVSLNKNLRAKVINKDDLDVDKEVAVLITKVSPPFSVECKVIDQEFEIIDEDAKDISSLNLEDVGKRFSFHCVVEEIFQTSGPTLFTIFDGSGALTAKSFVGPGKRAFPELVEKSAVKANVLVSERDGNIECVLESFERLEDVKEDKLLQKIQEKLNEKAAPSNISFMVKSEILEKLRPKIVELAREIKKAILESRPIIVRHHADCDGYCGGIAIERAVIPAIVDQHKDENAQWRYYRRAPSKAPFYEYVDVIKDLAFALQDMAKFGLKEPLVILVDNGSTEEDIMSIKKIKIYGAKVVVIDHHFPGLLVDGKVLVDEFVDAHVNPYLVGGNSKLTAGMLASEIARFVNKDVVNIDFLPALAGVADHSDGSEFNQYIDIAKNKGFDLAYLNDMALCVDFEAYYLKFIEGRGLVDDLLGSDIAKHKKIVSLMIPDIVEKNAQQLEVAKHFAIEEDLGKLVLVKIDILKCSFEGEYPPPGKLGGLLHRFMEEKHKKPVITLSVGDNFASIRVSDSLTDFNINSIVHELSSLKPYCFVSGGGYEHAGSIKFIESGKVEVLDYVVGCVKRC